MEFLEERYELDMFFVFIVLRKKSRRVGRDLFIETQYLEDILAELDKGSTLTTPKNLTPTQSGIASMVQSSLASTLATRPKEIKLLLCYYELV